MKKIEKLIKEKDKLINKAHYDKSDPLIIQLDSKINELIYHDKSYKTFSDLSD